MTIKRRRHTRISRLALRKGHVTQEQIKACTDEGEEDPDLSTMIFKGHLTHKQLASLEEEARTEEDLIAEHLEPDTGVRVGKYVLLKQLGAGGMATVWRASDPALDRFVALKFLSEMGSGDFERFRREARLAAKLIHPNIAAVYEFDTVGGTSYIAMQCVEGRTLGRLRLQPKTAARYMRQAALAIHFAHRHGVIHRDLKPANLMVDREGHLYVMDFGLAKRLRGIMPGGKRAPEDDATIGGAQGEFILGTPNYMAPEQVAGKVDARVDIYGLGATFYAVLGGRPPFKGGSVSEILKKTLSHAPVPLSRLNPDVPEELEAIITRCMQKNKSMRYRSAKDLTDDLDRFLRGEAVGAVRSTVTYRLKTTLRKNRRALVGGGALLGIVAIAIVVAAVLVKTGEGADSERLAKAQGLQQDGNLDAAEAEYRAILKSDAKNSAAKNGLKEVRGLKMDRLIEEIEAAVGAGKTFEAKRKLARLKELGARPLEVETLKRMIEATQGIRVAAAPAWPLVVKDSAGREAARLDSAGTINLSPGLYEVRAGSMRFPYRVNEGAAEGVELRLPETVRPGMIFVPSFGSKTVLGTWIDRTEATNAQYQEFLDGAFQKSARRYLYYPTFWSMSDPPYPEAEADDPVRGLDDIQAVEYLLWRGLRLPSRDEWLVAARGVDMRTYPWGDDPDIIDKISEPGDISKHDVSPYGAVGMASGADEPVWVESPRPRTIHHLMFDHLAWVGGTFGGDPERYRLDSGLWNLGTSSGVRGAETELAPDVAGDAEALSVLVGNKDAGVRAASIRAVVKLAPANLDSILTRAIRDPSPFVAGVAIRTLQARSVELDKLLANEQAATLFLAGRIEELEEGFRVAESRREPVSTLAAQVTALVYLGVDWRDTGARRRSMVGEARYHGADVEPLFHLYWRAVTSPLTDLNTQIDAWMGSPGEVTYSCASMTLLRELLKMEEDAAGRQAWYTRYQIERRMPRLKSESTDDPNHHCKAARNLLAAMRAAGLD